MAPRKSFVCEVDDQPPQPVGPDNESVLYVEFRVTFQALAQVLTNIQGNL